MPYTYKSVAFVWLIIFALFAVSASGVVGGRWFILLLLVAVAAPSLVLRSPGRSATTSSERPFFVEASGRKRSPSTEGIAIHGWENEGGAYRMPLSSAVREPARAAS